MSVSEIDDADVKSLITSAFTTNDEDLEEFKKYANQKKTNIDSWEKVALNSVNNKALLYMEVELTVNELDRFVKDVEDHAKMRRYKKRTYSAGDWAVYRRKERNFIEKLELGKVIMNKMIEAISSEPDPILDESLEDMLSMSQKLGYIRQEIDPMKQLAVIGTHLMERFARILEREGVGHNFPVPKKEPKKKFFRRLIKDEVYTKQDVSEALPESSPTTTQEITTFDSVSHPINDEMFQSPASFIKEYAKRGGLLLEYKEISEVKNPWITQYIYTCTLDQITGPFTSRPADQSKMPRAPEQTRICLVRLDPNVTRARIDAFMRVRRIWKRASVDLLVGKRTSTLLHPAFTVIRECCPIMVFEKIKLGEFEVKRNGEKIRYVLENMTTQEEVDEATKHMVAYFLPREPMCAFTAIKEDPESLASIERLWRQITDGTAIGAYLVNDDGSKGKLIGCNMTLISKKDEKDVISGGRAFNVVLKAVINQSKAANVFEKYKITEYMAAFGLSVHPDYHGCQLGHRILESRRKLCKHLGLRVTGTVFTAGASQHLAKKLGFVTLSDWDYKSFEVDGEFPFYDIPEKLNQHRSLFQAIEYE